MLHCTATGDSPWDLREFAVEGRPRHVDDSESRAVASGGSAFPCDERFLHFELAVEAASSTLCGADGRPQRQHWPATPPPFVPEDRGTNYKFG
jgi:hypothetical protein